MRAMQMSIVFLVDEAIERRETWKGSKTEYMIVDFEHLTSEEITLDAWDENKEHSFSKLFNEGDILYGCCRAYLKKAYKKLIQKIDELVKFQFIKHIHSGLCQLISRIIGGMCYGKI